MTIRLLYYFKTLKMKEEADPKYGSVPNNSIKAGAVPALFQS
jgi:hypothetical protein